MDRPNIKAGIVIDNWKFKIYRKRLKEAGYTFEVLHRYPTINLKVIRIDTTDTIKLQKLIEKTESECQKQKSTIH